MNMLVIKKKMMRMVETIYLILSKIFLFVPWCVGKILRQNDMTCNFMLPFSHAAEEFSSLYVTNVFRPKTYKEMPNLIIPYSRNYSNCAIVIQGPICKTNDFTLESVRIYKKLYNNIVIILSTWKNENKNILSKFESEGVCVVLNDYPKYSGMGNVNFQTVSTMGGILKAKELAVDYVLKTRTDIRIYDPSFLEEMLFLSKTYPVIDDFSINQKSRFIIFSSNMFTPFHCPEFYFWGQIDDMVNFWNCTIRNVNTLPGNLIANTILAEHFSLKYCIENHLGGESEYAYDYFTRCLGDCDVSVKLWWKLVRDYFIALTHKDSHVLWYKYDYNRDESNFYCLYRRKIFTPTDNGNDIFDFYKWKSIYDMNNVIRPDDFEYLVNKPI